MKQIVVLGASYTGIAVSHSLLKHAYPKSKDFKVILVSTSSHLYWNFASVRGVVPGILRDEQLYAPIAPGFAHYPGGSFEFVEGTAESLDVSMKLVTIATTAGDRKPVDFTYDFLVIATGSRGGVNTPWKQNSTYQDSLETLHSYQVRVGKAKSIVIGGAGATGVETAGELGFAYKTSKEITIISNSHTLLPKAMPSVQQAALKELTKLGVKMLPNTTVASAVDNGSKTEIRLASGQVIEADLYIPSIGVTPNSSFLPKELLSSSGHVKVDSYLRVQGSLNIWAAGDITEVSYGSIHHAEEQALHVAKNIAAELTGTGAIVEYKRDEKFMLAASLGRKKGTGQAGTMKLPSFMVWWFKSRSLGVEKLPGLIKGERLVLGSSI
ncbi:MAG: hypothetical protein M1829_003494 [Trizodia sp. TS-e1964]|nr:MAG: hypothetical protein M1829_003494 [Trizodia sp. TS-e1964]